MITPAALVAAVGRRWRHRCYRDADGSVRLQRKDGQFAALTPGQYDAIQTRLAAAMRPVNRRLRWGFALSIPMMILTLACTSAIGADHVIDGLAIPGASMAAGVLVIAWWPFLFLWLHWRGTNAVDAAVEEVLLQFPLAPAPPPRPRAWQTLEIIALFVVGPGLLADIFGSIFPHAFDNTPLMGRSIGLWSAVGILVCALLIGPRLAARLNARLSSRAARLCADATAPDRVSSIVARTRASK